MNRLKNFKNNPVVRSAIQRDKDIKTTNRNVAIIGGALSTLLIPGGPLAGIGRKAIGQAFKKAGSIGNTKKPDTVGNRIRQSENIYRYKTGKPANYDKTAVPRSHVSTAGAPRGASTFVGSYIGSNAQRKTGRTLERAVKEGPSKYFSRGTSAKTGITPGKRDSGRISERAYNRHRQVAGVRDKLSLSPGDKLQVKRIEKESLFANKEILKQTLLSNKKAREALKKK